MAKMKKKQQNEKLYCPYCGRLAVLLEEVGHGTLVAEVEVVGYLAHRHIGL